MKRNEIFVFNSEPKAVMLVTPDTMLHQKEVDSGAAERESLSLQHFPGYNVHNRATQPRHPLDITNTASRDIIQV